MKYNIIIIFMLSAMESIILNSPTPYAQLPRVTGEFAKAWLLMRIIGLE